MHSLLLIFLFYQTYYFGDCTIVIEFEETPNKTLVKLEKNLSIPTNGSSFCIQVFIERCDFTFLFTDSDTEDYNFRQFIRYTPNSLDIHQWHYGKEYCLQSNFSYNEPLVKSHQWTTICTSVNETIIQIAVNGAFFGSVERRRTEEHSLDQTHLEVSALYFGSFIEPKNKRGKISNLLIWPNSLSKELIEDYSENCIIDLPGDNLILNWNSLKLTDFNDLNNQQVTLRNVTLEEKCSNISIIEFLDEEMTFQSAVRLCDALGGDLFLPKSASDMELTSNLTDKDFWVPIIYENDGWIYFYTTQRGTERSR